jgi:hypothetical protein
VHYADLMRVKDGSKQLLHNFGSLTLTEDLLLLDFMEQFASAT